KTVSSVAQAEPKIVSGENKMKKSSEELLTSYRRLRRGLLHLHTKLIKQLPKEAIESGGKQLGIMHNGVLVLATMDESSVLMDHCLHTYRVNGKTVLVSIVCRPLNPMISCC